MVLFRSMNAVSLYTMATVVLLVWFGSAHNPLRVFRSVIRSFLASWTYRLLLLSVIAILVSNRYELRLEAMLGIQADYTAFVRHLEGGFVAGFQHLFVTAWLTPPLAFLYVVVFQSLLMASLALYSHRSDKRLFYAACWAVLITYTAALPFYLYVPVREVWSFDPGVRFVMLDVFPDFETQYRALSGIDNCFPSLHTSISVTLALLAARSGNRRWAWLCGICAALIIFTIFYMGIHWLTDSLGGIALSLFATTAALKLAGIGFGRSVDRPSADKSVSG